ncbi:Cytochrome oxidase assembly protein ShyY1 [Pseudomonas cuatrocienegasensis]|uniref:SURF1-like protein n=1 Tax=Pseudomonas cuatrocienegasensis TaxID=543360 RepID=A0ABY1BHC7_9PSED|nr:MULTISPECIES: SURF1 family protein [Pseudomonas]OEC33306.1 cytochrome oxidase biogenesis protein Surf1,facilitates heme A insertion [Pseudomonas sp. 21C1]SEQ87838.1 Cytochrome oxidase assembly protein ShyY1 [Pseudomonas cuatrocienegasensis]
MSEQYSQQRRKSREWGWAAFRPGLLPTAVVLLLLPALVALGFWQLARAAEKRELLAQHAALQVAAPVSLDSLENGTPQSYQRVRLQGFFDAGHSLLLDNRIRNGQAGVELLQPFYDQGSGLWVLLNRGWLAWPDRRVAPAFDTPDGALELVASIYVPLGGGFLQRPQREANSWPLLITEVKPALLWQQLGRGGLPYEARLQPGPAALQADWPVVAMSPDKHLGYAVQWFALAVALVGLFIYLGMHNAREIRHATSHRPA